MELCIINMNKRWSVGDSCPTPLPTQDIVTKTLIIYLNFNKDYLLLKVIASAKYEAHHSIL
ncbi:hypothetical protein DPMN_015787 [Dreissena polymorpha]|uniref:Uncharacterized protein n=1 Tax=Dreissena polymorpha TaxID=45954 RepID=A0A9D4N8F7_DREPO|nr:hypothetical protein DPMN_015787 [Dreissena polymorpha]